MSIVVAVLITALCPARSSGSAEINAVMMVPSLGSAETVAVEAVQSHLVDLPVDLQIAEMGSLDLDARALETLAASTAAKYRADIVFWTDSTDPGQVFFYVQRPDGNRMMRRNIESKKETKTSRLEAAAVIIRDALRAMIEGGEIEKSGLAPGDEEPGPSPHVEIVEPDADEGPWLGATVSYGLSMVEVDVLAVHGVRLGVQLYLSELWRLIAAYRIEMPYRVENGMIAIEVVHHPLEVGGAMEWAWGTLRLQTGATAVMNLITWEVVDTQDDVYPRADQQSFAMALSPFVSFSWQMTEVLLFYAAVAADVFLYQREFVVQAPQASSDLLTPWRISPYFQGGVSLLLY